MGMGQLTLLLHARRRVRARLWLACIQFLTWSLPCAASGVDAESYDQLHQRAVAAKLTGKAQTVTGVVEPAALGFTLMHEHLFVNFLPEALWPAKGSETSPALYRRMQQVGWSIPVTAAEIEFFNRRPLTLDMIDKMRQGWRARVNLSIEEEGEVADEITSFRERGGRTVVDVTPQGLGRDVQRLRAFSRRHGIQVIAGTGWYRWPFHEPAVAATSVDDLAMQMAREVLIGIDGTEIRAGIVGEIPLDSRSIAVPPEGEARLTNEAVSAHVRAAETRFDRIKVDERSRVPLEGVYAAEEIKVLRAAARASRLTGAALSLHAREPWLGYLPLILAEGVPVSRVIVGHAHPHFIDRELLERSLQAGVVLEADYLLQFYASSAPLGPIEQILDGIAWAIKNGHRDQVLLSLDLCYKVGQERYGGGGYATLHKYVFPRLRQRGVSDADLQHVMVENPKRLLSFVEPGRVRRER